MRIVENNRYKVMGIMDNFRGIKCSLATICVCVISATSSSSITVTPTDYCLLRIVENNRNKVMDNFRGIK